MPRLWKLVWFLLCPLTFYSFWQVAAVTDLVGGNFIHLTNVDVKDDRIQLFKSNMKQKASKLNINVSKVSDAKEVFRIEDGIREYKNSRSLPRRKRFVGFLAAAVGSYLIGLMIENDLKRFGIHPGDDSQNFDKILAGIGENYKAIKEIESKVDRNFIAVAAVLKMVEKVENTLEETRTEIRQRFKQVLENIHKLQVEDKISSLATFINDFIKDINLVKELPAYVRVTELERCNGVLNKLRDAVKSDGILHGNLYHIINQRLAIPKNSKDNLAFATLHILYYGVQTYVSMMFFVVEQYSFLIDHYYQKGDLEKGNEYFHLLQISFNDYKESLLDVNNKKRLVNKVVDILKEVIGMEAEIDGRKNSAKLQNWIEGLDLVKWEIQEMNLPIMIDQPTIITGKPDFNFSKIITPIGEWKSGAKVYYAIQYKNNDTYSKLGEWSDPLLVSDKANPILKIPVDSKRRTRIIFRKFNNEKPQLVGVLNDKYQTRFRDINRDAYDAASRFNAENIAVKEIGILISDGADINAIFERGRSTIHAAARSGYSLLVQELLISNNATDINAKDYFGYTPLHIAAEADHENFVQLLMDNGADLNVKTHFDELTPLHIAAHKGYEVTVRTLIQSLSIDVNAKDKEGFTPLHNSVFGGPSVIRALMSNQNIDMNAKSKEGLTALHLSSINNYLDVTETLLESKIIDINAKAEGNLTALHFASMFGNVKIVKFLITHLKIDVNAESINKWTPLHIAVFFKRMNIISELLKSNNTNIDSSAEGDVTALHFAVMHGNLELISILIDNGANIEARTNNGLTPLLLSVSSKNSSVDIVKYLIEKGSNLTAFDVKGDNYLRLAYKSADLNVFKYVFNEHFANFSYRHEKVEDFKDLLHEGLRVGNLDAVKYLMENKGIDILTYEPYSLLRTVVNRAPENANKEVFVYLVEKGAKGPDGESPLHFAAYSGSLDLVQYLVEVKNYYVNDADSSNRTPLHWAASYGNLDVFKYFVENTDANIRAQDKDGSTPLHNAVWFGRLNVIKYLIDKEIISVILHAKDRRGLTPLHLAAKSGSLPIVKTLVENGADVSNLDLNEKTPLNIADDSVKAFILHTFDVKYESGRELICDFFKRYILRRLKNRIEVVKYLAKQDRDFYFIPCETISYPEKLKVCLRDQGDYSVYIDSDLCTIIQ